MDDFEKDVARLKKLRRELAADEHVLKEREYRTLALLAGGLSLIGAFTQYVSAAVLIQPHARKQFFMASAIVVVLVLLGIFFMRARKSDIGISGYLKIEKTLLINEMPNIFQILSLLGFLNVLLKQEFVKVLVTLVITFLLLVYLTSKRTDMVSALPELKGKVTSSVTSYLSLSLGAIIGLGVYGLASLISVQIR